MKKRVLIFVASRVRDAASLSVLGELLKRKGHDVAYASPASVGFMLRSWRPHLFFHTNPDMIVGYYKAGLIGPAAGPAVVIFPQEGMNFAERDIRRWYDPYKDPGLAASIDQIFFWNEYERSWVEENTALTADQLSVSGGIRLDLARYANGAQRQNNPKRIGFIGRFTHLNRFDATNIAFKTLHSPKPQTDTSSDKLIELIDSQYRTLSCYSYVMSRIAKESGHRICVRGHHTESKNGDIYRTLRKIYGDLIEFDNGPSVYHWARGMDAIVTTTSTTIAEIYLAGTPVINIDELTGAARFMSQGPLADASEPILLKCCSGHSLPGSYGELFGALEHFLAHEYAHERNLQIEQFLAKGYSWPFTRSAIGIIAEKIDDILRTESGKSVSAGPMSPKFGGDLYYFYWLMTKAPGSARGTAEIYYNRLLHARPDYVRPTADAIEQEFRMLKSDAPMDNRPQSATAA